MNDIKNVLCTLNFEDEYIAKLKSAFAPAKFVICNNSNVQGIEAALQDADVALISGSLDNRFLKSPNLRWVHCDQAGLERSARPEVFSHSLAVTSSAGRSAPALAEHCMFFMLSFAYGSATLYEAQKQHRFGGGQSSLEALYGKTVGILGLGNTGKELAVRCKAFNMQVLAYRRRNEELPSGVDRCYCSDLGESPDELLKQSDYIVLTLPLSDKTYQMIGSRELGLMKKTAVIINLGRGAILDEEALIQALRQGKISGAGLDTFSQEPLPAESPLWDCPNVMITPHFTPPIPEKTQRSVDIICENARRFRTGEPLINLLQKEDVYTKLKS